MLDKPQQDTPTLPLDMPRAARPRSTSLLGVIAKYDEAEKATGFPEHGDNCTFA
jgi:hypothetical protein